MHEDFVFHGRLLLLSVYPQVLAATYSVDILACCLMATHQCKERVMATTRIPRRDGFMLEVHRRARCIASTNPSASARVRFSVTAIVRQSRSAGYHRPSGKPA